MRDGRSGFETGRLLEQRIRRRGWIKLWSGLGFLAAVLYAAGWIAAPETVRQTTSWAAQHIREAGRSAATPASAASGPERPAAVEPAAVLRPAQAVKTAGGPAHAARDVQRLALAIYHEAGAGSSAERELVAQVALNRAAATTPRKPLCTIVYLGLGRPHGCLFKRTCRNIGQMPSDAVRWADAVSLAERMASGDGLKPELAAASHFRVKTEAAQWVAGLFALAEVGRFKVYTTAPVDVAGGQQSSAPDGVAAAASTATVAGEPPPKPVVRKPAAQVAKKGAGPPESFAPWDRSSN